MEKGRNVREQMREKAVVDEAEGRKRHRASESSVLHNCLAYLGRYPGVRVWRNNVGVAKDVRTGRAVAFGLPGSSDIIGIRTVRTEAPSHVSGVIDGRTCVVASATPIGQFIAVECKSARGRLSAQQINFRAMIESHGGVYVLARSVEDLYSEFPPV